MRAVSVILAAFGFDEHKRAVLT